MESVKSAEVEEASGVTVILFQPPDFGPKQSNRHPSKSNYNSLPRRKHQPNTAPPVPERKHRSKKRLPPLPPLPPRVPPRVDMELGMFNQIAQITDHLYLSSAAAVRIDRLKSYNINFVINLTMEIPNIAGCNIESMQIHIDDSPGAHLNLYFDKCTDKIKQVHQQGGKTLVHCIAGVSRSASICLAYLMKYQGMTLENAYRHVRRRRSVIRPNVGFWSQLIEYERKLFGRNTVKMVNTSMGYIPDVYEEESRGMIGLGGSRSRLGNRYGYR